GGAAWRRARGRRGYAGGARARRGVNSRWSAAASVQTGTCARYGASLPRGSACGAAGPSPRQFSRLLRWSLDRAGATGDRILASRVGPRGLQGEAGASRRPPAAASPRSAGPARPLSRRETVTRAAANSAARRDVGFSLVGVP